MDTLLLHQTYWAREVRTQLVRAEEALSQALQALCVLGEYPEDTSPITEEGDTLKGSLVELSVRARQLRQVGHTLTERFRTSQEAEKEALRTTRRFRRGPGRATPPRRKPAPNRKRIGTW